MKPTLKPEQSFGKPHKGFTVTEVDTANGVYHAYWDGQFVKPLNNGVDCTVMWCPTVVIPIQEFEELNAQFIPEGVMTYLRVQLFEDYQKEA